jgi:hypothetical protein
MVNQAQHEIIIEMPSGLAPSGSTNVLRLPMIADSEIRGGKRAIERQFLDANGSGPVRRQRVEWAIHGPLGASLESSAGYLGVNFTRNLDTRWYQRLIPTAEQNLVDLTGDDPPGIDGSVFDEGIFDTSYFGSPLGSGTSGDGPDVVVFAEQNNYLLVMRGSLLTQVDTTTTPWTVVSTTALDADALDADHWRGTVKIALGTTAAMQRVVGATSSGVVLADVTATTPAETVYASAIKRGSDRAWYVNANQAQSTYNFAGFTLDDFVNLANPFQVGDPTAGMNGIGPFGPLTMFGGMDNLYSFTDQGKPVPLSRALYNHHSVWNGNQWADPGWTWNFATSAIGLRAVSPGGIDNPVGIGETMRQFTGHNGIAYTVYSERGELWVIYYTTGGAIYGYRGTFGQETAGSGQPLLFPWFYKASSWSQAMFSTVTGAADQGVFIIRGDGTNLVYSLIASDGRDDLYPSYTYDITGPFAAYMTTLNRNANLQKTLRLARFRARNLTSGSSWALAFAFDANQTDITNATYVTVGTVTTNGPQTLTPVSAGAPLANISGRTMTPRLTLVAGGSGADTTPPEISGTLEVEYDERPEQYEQINVACYFTSPSGRPESEIWSLLASLLGQDVPAPITLQIPDNLPPGVSTASGGGTYYAHLTGVTKRTDVTRDDVEGYSLQFDCWPQAEAI